MDALIAENKMLKNQVTRLNIQADERNKEQFNFILENAVLKNKVENLENKIEELMKLSEASDKIL